MLRHITGIVGCRSGNFMTCVASIRGKKTKPPFPTPLTDFCKDVDKNAFFIEYENIPELHNASERVKKIFTIDYGTLEDKRRKKMHDLIKKIDVDNQSLDEVTQLVKMTMTIKRMQQKYLKKRKNNKALVPIIIELVKLRQSLISKLRDHQFEIYARALQYLELEHYFEEQHEIRATSLADEVVDMHIRAFAESRRLAAASALRKNKLFKLKDDYINELSAKNDL